MSSPRSCPRCGAAVPTGEALEGLCPACLFRAAGVGRRVDDEADRPELEEVRALFPDLIVEAVLGRGGMGVVYRARQRKLERPVALKLLRKELSDDPAFGERFLREARALARLTHPNVVGVYDFGEVAGRCYLLMELVEGVGLRDLIVTGELTSTEALQIVPQICEGLQYAHEQGVVHRDIKPENILLDKAGRVRIADFGLAKLASDGVDWTLTRQSQVMGTPHYMAPEQLRRTRDVDHRADLYSLGVVFYEMLTGNLPIGHFELPSSSAHSAPGLDRVVLKALEREPDQRYQAASEIKEDVEGLEATPAPKPRRRSAQREDRSSTREPSWIEILPGPRVWIPLASVVLSWVLYYLVGTQVGSPGLALSHDWHAAGYPFAFLGLYGLVNGALSTCSWAARALVATLSFVTGVVTLAILCMPPGHVMGFYLLTRVDVALEVLAAVFLVGAHIFLELAFLRWRFQPAIGAFVLFVLGVVTHTSIYLRFQRFEGYYHAFGMLAILGLTSTLLRLPELGLGDVSNRRLATTGIALALTLLGAAMYFHRYLF